MRWKSFVGVALPSRNPSTRPLWLSLGLSIITVVATALLGGPMLRMLDTARIGSISGLHLEAAVNWIYCDRYGETTSASDANRQQINLAEIRDPTHYSRSVRSLLAGVFGDPRGYCAQPAYKTDLSEPGMILVDAAALALLPNATLQQLGWALATARLAMIAMFGWCALAAGASALYVLPLVSTATYFTMLPGGHALYAHYPFILPLALLQVCAGFIVVRSDRTLTKIAGFAALGLCTAFLGNLRTSHYPLGLAVCVLLLLFERFRSGRHRRYYALAASGAAAFAVAVVVFHLAFIAPLRAPGRPNHHVIAHPLVLGLATLGNDLARREGIVWDDSAGLALARRIDPAAQYLDERYEPALFTYYARLWELYPWEMVNIYREKLGKTSADVFRFLADTRAELFWPEKNGVWTSALAAPARLLSPYFTLGGVLLLAAASGLFMTRRNIQEAWFITAISVVGVLAFTEAAMILSGVVLWYTPVMVFATVAAGLLPLEYALVALSMALERRWDDKLE